MARSKCYVVSEKRGDEERLLAVMRADKDDAVMAMVSIGMSETLTLASEVYAREAR